MLMISSISNVRLIVQVAFSQNKSNIKILENRFFTRKTHNSFLILIKISFCLAALTGMGHGRHFLTAAASVLIGLATTQHID